MENKNKITIGKNICDMKTIDIFNCKYKKLLLAKSILGDFSYLQFFYRALSHYVMGAMLVSQNKKMAAMMVRKKAKKII